jgi:hypothetical protein
VLVGNFSEGTPGRQGVKFLHRAAASLTHGLRLDVGQPGIVRPRIGADRGPMAALENVAIDQQPANTSGAHVAERDLLDGGGHGPLKRGRGGQAIALPERAGKELRILACGRPDLPKHKRTRGNFAETFYPQSPDFALFDPVSFAAIKGGKMREMLISQGF